MQTNDREYNLKTLPRRNGQRMKPRMKWAIGYVLLGFSVSFTVWWYWIGPIMAPAGSKQANNVQGVAPIEEHRRVTARQVGTSTRVLTSALDVDYTEVTNERRKCFNDAESLGSVSLVTILGNPRSFHGKRVIVRGYAIFDFEHNAIYPSRDMAVSFKNGVWIDYDKGISVEKFYGKEFVPVFLKAVYDSEDGGHLGMSTGSFCFVSRLYRIAEPGTESR